MSVPSLEQRLNRTKIMLGDEKLNQLQNSFVVIVGIGAVGGYALEAIARSGVNNIRVVDFDKIEESNINRQILATNQTINRYKAQLALERIKSINPYCQVDKQILFVSDANIETVLSGGFGFDKPSLVIDAIDAVSSKIVLLSNCLKKQIPAISSMGAALRSKTQYITTDDIMKTKGCGLAKQVRIGLKPYLATPKSLSGIDCVYSTQPVEQTIYDACKQHNEGKKTLGSLPTIPGIFGLMLANMAIEKLTQDKSI